MRANIKFYRDNGEFIYEVWIDQLEYCNKKVVWFDTPIVENEIALSKITIQATEDGVTGDH